MRLLFITWLLLLAVIVPDKSNAQNRLDYFLRGDTIVYKGKPTLLLKSDSKFLKYGEFYITTLDGTPLAKLMPDTIFIPGVTDFEYVSIQMDEPKVTLYRLFDDSAYYYATNDVASAYLFEEDKIDNERIKQLTSDQKYITGQQFQVIKNLEIDSIKYYDAINSERAIKVNNKTIATYKFIDWKQRCYEIRDDNLSQLRGEYYYLYNSSHKKVGELGLTSDRFWQDISTISGLRLSNRDYNLWHYKNDVQLVSLTAKILLCNLLLQFPSMN